MGSEMCIRDRNWSSECEFCREHNIKVHDYDYDQLIANVVRSHVGSALQLARTFVRVRRQVFCCIGLPLEKSRERMAELVNEYDGKPCDGLIPAVVLRTKLRESSVPSLYIGR